jgi:N-acyl homoserine lactone hydrolase
VIRVHAIHTGTAEIHERQLAGEGRGTARLLRTLLDRHWAHLHSDHAGGLAAVAGCEIVVSETEYATAKGWPGRLRGYLPQHWPAGFAPRRVALPEQPYGPFPRSLALTEAGDVVLVDTAGHTPGHVSVIVEDGDGPRLCFAGDAAYTQDQMLQGRVDGISPSDDRALETLARLQRLVAERPTVFLPTHDPDSAGRLERREPAPPRSRARA